MPVACKETYKLPVNNLYRKVLNYQGGTWELNEAGSYVPNGVFGYFVSMAMQPLRRSGVRGELSDGAMQKDEETGIVWTDHEVCIGCKTCQTVCPYDAPTYDDEAGYMLKCDMCKASWKRAEQAPLRHRLPYARARFRHARGHDREVRRGRRRGGALPKDTTHPNLIMNPHRDAQKSGSGTGALVNLEEEI